MRLLHLGFCAGRAGFRFLGGTLDAMLVRLLTLEFCAGRAGFPFLGGILEGVLESRCNSLDQPLHRPRTRGDEE